MSARSGDSLWTESRPASLTVMTDQLKMRKMTLLRLRLVYGLPVFEQRPPDAVDVLDLQVTNRRADTYRGHCCRQTGRQVQETLPAGSARRRRTRLI